MIRLFIMMLFVLQMVTSGIMPVCATESERATETAVSPYLGEPGATLAFFARGFDDHETVGYWFNTPDGSMREDKFSYVTTAFEDRADWQWTVPTDAPLGVWTAVAKGTKSGVERIIQFEISAATSAMAVAPPSTLNSPDVAVEPLSAVAGTRFAFSASGYNTREMVYYWLTNPEGLIYSNDSYNIQANDNGTAYWNWLSPENALPGVWMMVGRGDTTEVQQVMYFTVEQNPDAVNSSPVAVTYIAPTGETVVNSSDVAVEPPVLSPGERVYFSAAGFDERETLYFWAEAPSGERYKKDKYKLRANVDGVAYWNWQTPDEAEIGVWKMYAEGKNEITNHVIYFQIVDAATPVQAIPQPAQPADNMGMPVNPPGVAVEPLVAQADSHVAFYATGFQARETVSYWAVAPDGTLYDNSKYTSISNEAGRVDWQWHVPDDATPGVWYMHARGDMSIIEPVIGFVVENPNVVVLPPQEDIARDPVAGVAGERFAFYATGFPAGETVIYWAVSPDGETFDNSKYNAKSNDDGRADWNWLAPDEATPGTWTMHVQGQESLVTRSITVEIYP